MYYDRAEAEAETETGSRKAVKNRVNGDISARGRKRGREDDDKPRVSNRRVDPRDLRLKLQKRHHGLQSGRGVRDLRDKLSGTPRSSNPQKSKREVARPAKKNVAGKTKSETRRTALNKATKKKSQQAADASVDSFLESLGLEKYSTAFQVEEVDMDALMHMTDDDLKAMLMPMGPRKKILLALGSKR